MELREFITGVIDEIFDAVSEEQQKYYPNNKKMLPIIAPSSIPEPSPMHKNIRKTDTIHFDLAITESQSVGKGASGKAGISIVSIGAGVQKENEAQTVQRVSFDITVCYPGVSNAQSSPSSQQ